MSSTSGQPSDPSWQRWAGASSLLDNLADESLGVKDLVALTGEHTPGWVHQLAVPPNWQQADIPDTETASLRPARTLVWGARADGGWEATDTIQVYGYTGLPLFGDVYNSTARTLHDLDAHDLQTHMLAVPAGPGIAAERSTALLAMDDRQIWIQLTNYVAGSHEPHAGRLIVHSLYIAEQVHSQLIDDIAVLTDTVHHAFTTLATHGSVGAG
jgi:hypothetical protein